MIDWGVVFGKTNEGGIEGGGERGFEIDLELLEGDNKGAGIFRMISSGYSLASIADNLEAS